SEKSERTGTGKEQEDQEASQHCRKCIEGLDDGDKPSLSAKFLEMDESPDRDSNRRTDKGCRERNQERPCRDLKNFLIKGYNQLNRLDDSFNNFIHAGILLKWS